MGLNRRSALVCVKTGTPQHLSTDRRQRDHDCWLVLTFPWSLCFQTPLTTSSQKLLLHEESISPSQGVKWPLVLLMGFDVGCLKKKKKKNHLKWKSLGSESLLFIKDRAKLRNRTSKIIPGHYKRPSGNRLKVSDELHVQHKNKARHGCSVCHEEPRGAKFRNVLRMPHFTGPQLNTHWSW